MPIPYAETTIKVSRRPQLAEGTWVDPYDPAPEPTTVATGVRAVISTSSGREATAGGQQSITELRLACDEFAGGLSHYDIVTDEPSGEEYEVTWSRARTGMGLDHFSAGLKQTKGVAGGGSQNQ